MSLKPNLPLAAYVAATLLCALPSAQAQVRPAPAEPASTSATNGGLFDALIEHSPDWREGAIGELPPLPQDSDLIPFTVSPTSRFHFSLDPNSVSIGQDGVIRYTVVIATPAGARNVRYEGIHCAGNEWRLYSGANEAGTRWDNASTSWTQIENASANGYHAALANGFFCDNRMPADTDARRLVQNVRYNRTIMDRDYR